jgi:hypothetical protein
VLHARSIPLLAASRAALADESGLLSRDEAGFTVDESQNFLSGGMLVNTMIGVMTE